jgi:hypothetical protein
MSVEISEGKSATLRVRADGEELNYQWFAGDVEIAGARSPSYKTGSAGTYRVVVGNAAGTVTSDLATVTLSPREVAPKITKQPKSLTLAPGTTATFTVEASGTDLEYQWFDATGAIANATTAVLKTTIAGTYHVVVSNSAGSVQSKDVTLTALPL